MVLNVLKDLRVLESKTLQIKYKLLNSYLRFKIQIEQQGLSYSTSTKRQRKYCFINCIVHKSLNKQMHIIQQQSQMNKYLRR